MAASPEVRLKRFLHYGSELPIYSASRGLLKFNEKSCPSINTLITAGKEKEVGLQIIKAHSDGYAVRREALLHAMALCALNKTSASLREMTYNAVRMVCAKPEDLFLFVNYLHDLNNNKIHSGNGLRRAISDWYLKKDVMEFAEIISKKRGYYRWTHVDLMRIAHIKSDDVARQVVIQYAFTGNIKELKEKYKNVKEAQPVLQYLKVAADVRTSQDPVMVARAIQSNSLSMGHLPHHNKDILHSDEVWCALLLGMPLEEMLDRLQFVSRHQLLSGGRRGSARNLTRRYCDAISHAKALAESPVHPARLLIELSTYNLIAKEKISLATKLKHTAAVRKPPPINEQIAEELAKVMDSAFKLLVPTGQRYVVAVDTRSKMWAKRCWKNRYVSCADAAALLALSVARCERDVTVGFYAGPHSPFTVVNVVTADTTLTALVASMKKHQQDEAAASEPATASSTTTGGGSSGRAGAGVEDALDMKLLAACLADSVKTPIAAQMLDWAEQNKRSVDVFVALGDNQLSTTDLATKLNRYRSVMRLQNAKLVHVHLNGPAKNEAKSKGNGLLAVHGFDKNVPRVIEAFARGAF
ncbi:hypothetical protein LSTR_LSTR013904 [Laodelphax striatellus]|uniref:TROVE domain-containing protein n=1 Tax=Laodelphax striatellus TaxID=195883 RepID=A0A482X436_LAOST|nr:hypothetical protein LSTR_LSTR013904 [Laodelphax striatellus]